ncbi:DUF6600 domain-containing protein [Duganella hordei]|uniref:DUF6600 domain-containing protein n=1 Tax=Duganella hordei TaxID=2865934 RepID=UPI0030E9FE0C
MSYPFRIVVALAGASLLYSGVVLADPPSRVARLAYSSGPVSLSPVGRDDWQAAGINRPLVAGDRVWAADGARDEVQAGPANVRMGANTLVTLLNVDDRTTQLQLSQGRLNLRVRQMRPDEVLEIDTPNLAFNIRKRGHYRLDVDASGNATQVSVIDGQGEAYGEGNAYLIDPGQSYRFGGTNLTDFSVTQPPPADEFDQWAAQRDRRLDHPASVRYVSSDVVGYEDLDDNGNWRDVPGYGNVWMPAHVASDWAPYRDGHWAWVDPWGWTWVDDAPWGFAVTHYGRWAQTPAGWGWLPGPVAQRPVYAPALVVFVGGANLLLDERSRDHGVAWFPLGPREVYRPSYRASPRYVTNINVSNTVVNQTQITNVYNNVQVNNIRYVNRQAVTAVPAAAFAQSQPVRGHAMHVSPQQLAAAPLATSAPARPQRPAPGTHEGPRPAPALLARQAVARTAPAAMAPRVHLVKADHPAAPMPVPAHAGPPAPQIAAHADPRRPQPGAQPAPRDQAHPQPQPTPRPQELAHAQPRPQPMPSHEQPQPQTAPRPQELAHAQPRPQPMPPHEQPHQQPQPQTAPKPQELAHAQPRPQPMPPHEQPHQQPQPAPRPQELAHAQPRPQPAPPPHEHTQPHPQPAPQQHEQAHGQPHPQPGQEPPSREAAHHDPKHEPKRE